MFGERRCPGPDAIIAVLRALGAEIGSVSDVEDAIASYRRRRLRCTVEPVSVVRAGCGVLRLRLSAERAEEHIRLRIDLEDGGLRNIELQLDELPPLAAARYGDASYVLKHARLPADLPLGYHRGTLEVGGDMVETLIISAPDAAVGPRDLGRRPGWGGFLPLYALRSDRDWGAGDFTDLAALASWIGEIGGDTVATLPLLPTDSGALGGPSPYSPVSRLFWSELFIDLTVVPELRQCPSADRLLLSAEGQQRLRGLRSATEVDYAGISEIKRQLLSEMAGLFFSSTMPGQRRARFDRFLERHPEVDAYARFRAALRRHGAPWSQWPAHMRNGEIRRTDYDPAVHRSHLYGQWLAHEQLEGVAEGMRRNDMYLYLDLPLGVPADSFDTWRFRHQFAAGATAGAPPDTFFLRGQNWGLPPAHPERSREQGYAYLRACLGHHLGVAGMLRIDHVMAFHRLYWVPDGFPATEGVYVRYPAPELWAIVALESHRNQAVIVGEDLGTVPRAVRRAMRANRAHRIFVVQTEIAEDRLPCLEPPAPDSIACVNTHDMPTFAAYSRRADLQDLAALGILDEQMFERESARRADKLRVLSQFLAHGGWLSPAGDAEDRETEAAEDRDAEIADLLRGSLCFLADSEAASMIVNLEDLWLEDRPQNVPGTSHERPNWRRRARYTLEQMKHLPGVIEALAIAEQRRRLSRESNGE